MVEHDYLVVHSGPKSTWAHLKKMGVTTYCWITRGWKFKMRTFAVTGRPGSDEHTATYKFNSNDNEESGALSTILYGLSLGFAKYVHRHYRVVVVFRNIRASKVLEVIDPMMFRPHMFIDETPIIQSEILHTVPANMCLTNSSAQFTSLDRNSILTITDLGDA
jgi:hypothetical protein